MLQINLSLTELLSSDVIVPYFLVRLDFSSVSPIYITDAPYDIVYEENIYSSDGGLLSLSPPKAEADVSRDLFNIVVSDVTNELRQILSYESIGVPASITASFISSETNELIPEYLPVYSGTISKASWVIDKDSPNITIECSGPLTKLRQITNRSTNSSNQKAFYPADTCMDNSYDTNSEATKKWGGTA